ncbi:MAG: glycosyltransferase [Cyclobacteriaceae bacterium]|nr:glycosyltransferase [Cyclobacteriaceae bacterium]
MKIAFIIPYPVAQAPSQRFRFEQYVLLLKERYAVDFYPFWSDRAWKILYDEGKVTSKIWFLIAGYIKRCFLLLRIPRYDLIFLHREAAPLGPPFFEWVIAKIMRKKVIYDFDDAIWLPNTSEQNRVASFLKWHSKTPSIIRWSHKISCGNPWLAAYAINFNKNVYVIPTTIEDRWLRFPMKSHSNTAPVKLVWTGTHSTMKYLDDLLPALDDLNNEMSFEFLLISNKMPAWSRAYLKFEFWSKEKEVEQLVQGDIGLMPLKDSDWEKGKCGFKAIQYMALGLPALVSPVGVNTSIVQHGLNGFLCESLLEWKRFLKLLIQDASRREEMGENAREKIRNNYTVEAVKDEFLELFTL